MKLSKESWHGLLYYSAYNKDMPESLCRYFWGLVIAIILFIPSIFGHVWNFYKYFRNRNSNDWGIYNMDHAASFWSFHILACILFGTLSVDNKTHVGVIGHMRYNQWIGVWDLYLNGLVAISIMLGVGGIILGIGALIVYGIRGISEAIYNRRYDKALAEYKLTYTGDPKFLTYNFHLDYTEMKREKRERRLYNKRKYLLIEYIKGFMGRYCPRITWVNKDKK